MRGFETLFRILFSIYVSIIRSAPWNFFRKYGYRARAVEHLRRQEVSERVFSSISRRQEASEQAFSSIFRSPPRASIYRRHVASERACLSIFDVRWLRSEALRGGSRPAASVPQVSAPQGRVQPIFVYRYLCLRKTPAPEFLGNFTHVDILMCFSHNY